MTRSVAALRLVRPAELQRARRSHARPSGVPGRSYSQYSAILALQRAAGNAAVTNFLAGRIQEGRFIPSPAAAITVQLTPQGQVKKPAPRDVVLVLSPVAERPDAVTEAAVIAPDADILYATSLQEMVDRLKTLKAPVKTLFFLGHSDADGDIVFETPKSRDFVPAEKIAKSVQGVVQVESIDFHGCAVAVKPDEMDKVKKALKATKARGSTCEMVRQVAGPIRGPGKKGKAITDRKSFDLTKTENRKFFDAGLQKLRDAFGDDRKKCIINDSEDGYFQAHGKLVAVWANPESISGNDAFDKDKSVCFGDLKLETVDPSKNPVIDENQCKLIEIR